MSIFSIFTLCGGLAFFLFGMNIMSKNLEKVAGGKLEATLRKLTSNPFKSLLLGAGITIAIQSSSAMTVMLVGLVNSGIMELGQTVGVIMGADIGTTLTAWILSMAGIESSNVFISMLKPENFSPLIALVGIVMNMVCKKGKRADVGIILLGFSVLMFGMELMKDAVSPLADMPEFEQLLVAFENPILSLLVGAIFTGIIQSSAASIGILQALALTGTISYRMAIPIIMGLNIGTCVTALISSIGVNRSAKRVALVHISIKIIGAIVWLTVFCIAVAVFPFSGIDNSISVLGIAIVHSIFNIATIVMLMPFSKLLVRLAERLLPDTKEKEKAVLLDERLLTSPPLAVAQCFDRTIEMAQLANAAFLQAKPLTFAYDAAIAAEIEKKEQALDTMEDKLGTFLIQLSSKQLSAEDSRKISEMLHAIGDFERIGDHAIHVMEIGKRLMESGTMFSEAAQQDFSVLFAALTEIMEMTCTAYEQQDIELAERVEPLEEVIDKITGKLKDKHIKRLQEGQCLPELGVPFSDLLIYCERISDHCSNVAVNMIQLAHETLENHDYLNELKAERTPEFLEVYRQYKKKYALQTEAS